MHNANNHTSMDETYAQLAMTICSAAAKRQPGRLLVGIAGPPGSGKSTVAAAVEQRIMADATTARSCKTQAVSMDGFHYPRSYLDTLPNREEAYVRRGAPWTFDVDGMVDFVARLRATADLPDSKRPVILGPSFDHALKDPKTDDVRIASDTTVVLLDGNYLLLDQDKWREISQLLDLRVFVDIAPSVARERVARRHVQAGIESTLEKGLQRFDANDRINGELIRQVILPFNISVRNV